MKQIKVIFFDLDNTLFDHARAERTALTRVIRKNAEIFSATSESEFIAIYDNYNKLLWKRLARGQITSAELKIQRFAMSLREAKCPSEQAEKLAELYFEEYTKLGFTFPNVQSTLDYLSPNYTLAILSNGFPAIQKNKLQRTNLESFFRYKLYSSDLGVMKPDPEIFRRAMQITNIGPHETVYVGDSYEDDICSSKEVGWTAIHFDPSGQFQEDGKADYHITDLSELTKIF